LRVIFAGTPEFAKAALKRLFNEGFVIPLVLTQPDRPAGRGMKLQASPVKQFAQEKGIAVAQPHSLRMDGKYPEEASAARAAIAAADADVMVVVAYGLILPQWVLDDMAPTLPTACGSLPPEGAFAPRGGPSALKPAPKLGCLNIHASLLPRWRGAAPIHRAIEAGDAKTGVTIMQMDAGLDTGDMLLTETLPIEKDDTTASLHDKLATVGARMVVDALALAAGDGLRPVKQAAEGVSYAHKIGKQEAAIDWSQPALVIARRVRAFDPFPGAATAAHGEVIKVWRCEIESETKKSGKTPSTVLAVNEAGVSVQCGQGVLRLTELQRAGGKRLSATEFLRGFALPAGVVLGASSNR
jgi:methionyl-tRNA formyltransferase